MTKKTEQIALLFNGRVGVPRKGEKVCPSCKGNGQMNKRIPFGLFMSGYFDPCGRCSATGVVKA